MPKVSVIIPCFNQGGYLDEAVDSVLQQSYNDYEIIVVNDGSTDRATLAKLSDYNKPKTSVIHTPNRGLVSARNIGIYEARGEYILPLDADDKIGKGYLDAAVTILDDDSQVGVVYCTAEKIGAVQEYWDLPEFIPERMLLDNLIFCTALFRKVDWQTIGGYRQNMKYGWEDWDFWLSMVELGRKVVRIPHVLFYYRVNDVSMNSSMTYAQKSLMMINLVRNHKRLYFANIATIFGALFKKRMLRKSRV